MREITKSTTWDDVKTVLVPMFIFALALLIVAVLVKVTTKKVTQPIDEVRKNVDQTTLEMPKP